jgi:hypothetical protein
MYVATGTALMKRILTVGALLMSGGALASAAPGLTLPAGTANATVVLESDASAGQFGDTISIAPDLSVGATDDLTLAVVHSQFARTGFRGVAGTGICVTDACARPYDTVGLEGSYSLRRGPLAIAANAGIHAWSFTRDHHVVKLGAKLRYRSGRVVLAAFPAVTLAITERDAMTPNRDRLWLPITAHYTVGRGVALGVGSGLKGPIAELDAGYEIATALLAGYTHSPTLSFGMSWVHGKMLGGELALPGDARGIDSRAVNVWASATY